MEHAKHPLTHTVWKFALCACTLAALLALIWSLPLTASAAATSGTCGNGLTWTFDANTKTLEISGSGVMTDWEWSTHAPWYAHRESIQTLIIGESVTGLGRYAFADLERLTTIQYNATQMNDYSSYNAFQYAGQRGNGLTVYIGANVTRIPANLFVTNFESTTPSIKKVVFAEDSVCTSIGEKAFSRCYYLTDINLPMSLTDIEAEAFSYCSGLPTLTIPQNVKRIGVKAFLECRGLTELHYNAIQAEDLSEGDAFASIGMDTAGCTVYIGSEVTRIPANIFSIVSIYNIKVQKVQFAADSACTSIGMNAFQGCGYLEEVSLPSHLATIEMGAFRDCAGLLKINLPMSLTTIGVNAFKGCKRLTDATIPAEVEEIGAQAFYECEGLKSVTIPRDIQVLGRAAFWGCSGLETIYYNATLLADCTGTEFLGAGGYENTVIYIGADVTRIPAKIFDWVKVQKVIFEENSVCTSIGAGAFQNCDRMYEINLPMSLTSIEEGAFYNCKSLGTLLIPQQVAEIGPRAFQECNSLSRIIFGGPAPDMAENAFLDLSAGVYYPADGEGWSNAIASTYGGKKITWKEHEHAWQNPVIITEPTCSSAGEKQEYCSFCNSYRTVVLASLEHTWGDWVMEQEPTCTQDGEFVKTCTACSETQSRVESKLSHDFGEWTVSEHPTCYRPGAEERACTRCEDTERREVAQVIHEYGEWVTVSGNKLIPPIVKERTCIYCADIVSTKDWSNIWITVLVAVALVGVVIGVINYIKAYKK